MTKPSHHTVTQHGFNGSLHLAISDLHEITAIKISCPIGASQTKPPTHCPNKYDPSDMMELPKLVITCNPVCLENYPLTPGGCMIISAEEVCKLPLETCSTKKARPLQCISTELRLQNG
jgi:hypothetical protein